MNIDDLRRLSKMNEGPALEYKLSHEKLSKDIWETISAFSNSEGGTILLGFRSVKAKHVPEGVVKAEKILDDFSSTVSEKFNFCPLVRTEIINMDGKDFIVIEVAESPVHQKPIYVKDAGPLKGGYKRIGAADIRLSDHDVHTFYLQRSGSLDSQVCDGVTVEDLDPVAFTGFRELRKLEAPNAPELKLTDEELLKSYRLMDDSGKINVAGILLFGKERVIGKHFPAFRLDIIRIRGTEWGKDRDPFLSRDLKGNLMYLRTAAIDFIEKFFLVPFKSDYRGDRIGDNAYFKMLREALTNLLMHQNFYKPNPSQVIIYNDRIEYYNPGYSLKNPDFFRSPGSVLRNPLIAAVFYDIDWAETKGTGLRASIALLKEEGFQIPEFFNDKLNDRFILKLAQPFLAPHITPQDTDHFAPQMIEHIENMDRTATILKYCEEPRTLTEIMDFLNLKSRGYFFDTIFKPLLDGDILKRTMPDKPTSKYQKYIAFKSKPEK
jgi:ATP-dependent DNA helicase RecG